MAESRFNDDLTASAYETLLLPLVFNPWSRLLISKANLKPGERVLDLACGPGTLANVAAEILGPTGHVSGADLSPQMLAQAKAKPPHPGSASIDYVEAPADRLPFAGASFDAVFCQQGLQFFPDQLAALKEARRVLKPGGRALFALWADKKAMTLFSGFLDAVDRVMANPPSRAAMGWLNSARLKELLAAAGFRDAWSGEESMQVELKRGLPQALEMVQGTTAGPPYRTMKDDEKVKFAGALAEILAPYTKDGVIRAPTRALIGVARA